MSTSGSVPLPGGPGDESPKKLDAFVRELARAAGELHLSRLTDPGEIKEKAPKDLVTEVDLLSEELLISRIRERYPDDAILSEEQGGEISPTGRTWLLDPVDGTANFARANPLFCVCISVVEGDEVKHAAVGAPRLGDVYHASSGGGAFRDSASGETYPLRVARAERLEDSFVGVDFSYQGGSDPAKNNILEVFRSCWQVRSLGSAGIRGPGSRQATSTSPSVPATPPGTTPPPPSSSPRPVVASRAWPENPGPTTPTASSPPTTKPSKQRY